MKNPNAQNPRIPPGQFLTMRFPVLHYGAVPKFNPETWTFRIWGEVEKSVEMSWKEFSELPRTKLTMDIHCVTTWTKLDTHWEGVSFKTLYDLGLLKPTKDAHFVIQHAEHGFMANLPLSVVQAENFLLATHYEGEPLSADHGAPLRGIVGAIPDRRDLKDVYFWKGAKWLRGLELTSRDHPGFWERAGYNNDADVWLEERRGSFFGF